MWIMPRFALDLFYPPARGAGRVCAMPTRKNLYPDSSRLLGEVWKNLDEIFGSMFSL